MLVETPMVMVRDEGNLRWIRLDRPETLNALQVEDLPALAAAVSDRPRHIQAIVLTGGKRAFSSGMHKDAFADCTPARARAVISQVAACLDAVRRVDVPTVAMVDGYCLGAAFEMILGCDFRVVSTRSVFGLPEVRLGIPSVIDAALLRHHVGLGLAKEIVLTGDLYNAAHLESCHLFNRVVEPSALHEAVMDLLGRVRGLTREVVAAQKDLFETWMNQGLQEGIDTSIEVFGRLFESPATLEAIASYRQKP